MTFSFALNDNTYFQSQKKANQIELRKVEFFLCTVIFRISGPLAEMKKMEKNEQN